MVTATELNIRKGPGTDYDRVGAYYFNTRVTIYARNGKWGQTKDGWISMDYVYVDGTVGNMNSEKGTLTGDYVNVRSGPGTEYGVVRSTREGDRVTVLHKVTISGMDWYCLADGWIAAKYVQLDKDKPAETEPTTPATEPTETTAATEPAATDPVTTDPPATDPVTTDPTNPTP
jgi:N-acetylmuramoyl-L-alanine amidase